MSEVRPHPTQPTNRRLVFDFVLSPTLTSTERNCRRVPRQNLYSARMAPEVKFTPYGVPYVVEFAHVFFLSNKKERGHQCPSTTSLPLPQARSTPRTRPRKSKFAGITDLFVLPKRDKNTKPLPALPPKSPLVRSSTLPSRPSVPSRKWSTGSVPPSYTSSRFRTKATAPGKASSASSISELSSPPAFPPPVIRNRTSHYYPDGLYIQSATNPTIALRSPSAVARLRQTIADALVASGVTAPPSEGQTNQPDGSSSGISSTQRLEALLSSGEYGQFKDALKSVGLTYSKCMVAKALPNGTSRIAVVDRFGGGRKTWNEDSFRVCAATRLGSMFIRKIGDSGRVELRTLTVWA
jgi:hypothetical protein